MLFLLWLTGLMVLVLLAVWSLEHNKKWVRFLHEIIKSVLPSLLLVFFGLIFREQIYSFLRPELKIEKIKCNQNERDQIAYGCDILLVNMYNLSVEDRQYKIKLIDGDEHSFISRCLYKKAPGIISNSKSMQQKPSCSYKMTINPYVQKIIHLKTKEDKEPKFELEEVLL